MALWKSSPRPEPSPEPSPAPPPPSAWEVVERLGEGPHGSVQLVRDAPGASPRLLKLLHPECTGAADFEVRLDEYLERSGLAPFTGGFARVLAVVLIGSLVTATVSYLVVEKPTLRLKDRMPWRRP